MFKDSNERKLKRFIKRMVKNGKSKEEITELLLKVGWKKELVDKLLDKYLKKIVEILPLYAKEEEKKDKGSLMSQIKDLNEKIDIITQEKKTRKEFKKKQFKLPFKIKSQLKKLALKSKVQVILLQRNKNIKPAIGEIRDGMLIIDKQTIHDCPMDCVGLWNGKVPTIILPEWDLKPISLSQIYNETLEQKRLSDPQKIIIRSIEFKESLMPKKISTKAIIIVIVITVIVMAILFGGGMR